MSEAKQVQFLLRMKESTKDRIRLEAQVYGVSMTAYTNYLIERQLQVEHKKERSC